MKDGEEVKEGRSSVLMATREEVVQKSLRSVLLPVTHRGQMRNRTATRYHPDNSQTTKYMGAWPFCCCCSKEK